MIRIARTILVAAFALVACGGEPAITSARLAGIMPSAADAPAGTDIRADLSGPKTLDEFVGAEEVRTKLRALGFKVAYVSTFTTPSFPADPTKAPPGATLYGSFAIALEDADAAHEGFTFYQRRLRTRAKDSAAVLTQDLGTESFSFRFSSLEDTPLPGIAFLWRTGNALFSVVGVGNPDPSPDAVRGLARVIAARAEKS